MHITESDEFKRDFKRLLKKYRTLEQDFSIAKQVIAADPTGCDSKHANILTKKGGTCIVKVRMMCRAVKGSSFRLIYYYDGGNIQILFIEIYFKGNKNNEDRQRYENVFAQLTEHN